MNFRSSLRPLLLPLVTLAVALAPAAAPAADEEFLAGLEAWKQWRHERLQQPDGWLSLVGLAWLTDGENPVGSDAAATVRLPAEKAPAHVGSVRLAGGRATFVAAPGVRVTVDGEPVTTVALRDDSAAEGPTILVHGPISFYLIERGGSFAMRIKDAESATLREFRGLEYFPADPAWRIEGSFEPAPPGSTLEVPNSVGRLERIAQPGWVNFELAGTRHRLIALDDTGDGRLFLVFGDRTNARETYGGGRFLYTDPPVNGRVVIDFNRAYSPPCVFTPFATCPLPTPENKLKVRVEAGEKTYAGAAAH